MLISNNNLGKIVYTCLFDNCYKSVYNNPKEVTVSYVRSFPCISSNLF